jgi:hypothetical protein
MLDKLSKELDIVVVVSAGNANPIMSQFGNRDELMAQARNNLLSDPHRLIDPATTALGITVGAITRYGEPKNY